ncbi:hypothetical protein L6452_39225 [Arctium lappa]|uniref:Uncharacterized protein n=1 Tax=Arctium lappa TaxID=4217 RepID=A0ACB8XSG3_ARCLA|nr:hypothetical protein L6452_39225 [Arctium lappa]
MRCGRKSGEKMKSRLTLEQGRNILKQMMMQQFPRKWEIGQKNISLGPIQRQTNLVDTQNIPCIVPNEFRTSYREEMNNETKESGENRQMESVPVKIKTGGDKVKERESEMLGFGRGKKIRPRRKSVKEKVRKELWQLVNHATTSNELGRKYTSEGIENFGELLGMEWTSQSRSDTKDPFTDTLDHNETAKKEALKMEREAELNGWGTQIEIDGL